MDFSLKTSGTGCTLWKVYINQKLRSEPNLDNRFQGDAEKFVGKNFVDDDFSFVVSVGRKIIKKNKEEERCQFLKELKKCASTLIGW